MTFTIRLADRRADQRAVSKLDTSFETTAIFEVDATARQLRLVEKLLPTPRTKRYPMADAFAAWSTWDTGWVAEDGGGVVGFAAVEFEPWHARLVLWHLYVARDRRREGVGRALIAKVEQHGRTLGAQRIWLETTSVNVPGITAYERLGFALCGIDRTVYDTLPYADEAAVYLAKSL